MSVVRDWRVWLWIVWGVHRWPSRGFDGVVTGLRGGGLGECLDPPWWRVDRWVRWALAPRELRRWEPMPTRHGATALVRAVAIRARRAHPFRGGRAP